MGNKKKSIMNKIEMNIEILAIYVDDFKCFKNYTIPFSPNYKILIEKKSDKKYTYNIQKKEVAFNIFGKDFGRVTALVGENGSGKSTIAKLLRLIASDKPPATTIIIVYLENGKEFIRHHKGGSDSINPSKNNIKICPKEKTEGLIDENFKNNLLDEYNTKLVYFSNLFSYSQEKWLDDKNSALVNISVDYTLRETLMFQDIEKKIESLDKNNIIDVQLFDITKEYYLKKLNKIINFLIFLDKKEQNELENDLKRIIRIPKSIFLNTVNLNTIFIKTKMFWNNYGVSDSIIDEIFQKQNISFNDLFFRSYLISLLNVINMKVSFKKKIAEEKQFISLSKNVEMNSTLEGIINEIHIVFQNVIEVKPLINLYEKFKQNLDIQNIKQGEIFGLSYSIQINNKSYPFLENLIQLNEYLQIELFTFNWSEYLSSGEEAILNQFSEYYHRLESFKDSNCIFVVDEGELYLHPRWQQSYLNILITFLKNITNVKNTKHLIITSHSPFIVSDIPKDNIVFLENIKGKCKVASPTFEKTFGANIHTLFMDSFFMDKGLIGEFAKSKINEVIEILIDGDISKVKEQEKYIRKIIEIIGEPIVKRKLTSLLNDKLLNLN